VRRDVARDAAKIRCAVDRRNGEVRARVRGAQDRPFAPTAKKSPAPDATVAACRSIVVAATLVQCAPASSVTTSAPASPTASPRIPSPNRTPCKSAETPLVCHAHVRPPSTVWPIVPCAPTAQPSKFPTHATPKSVVSPSDRAVHDTSSNVCANAPDAPTADTHLFGGGPSLGGGGLLLLLHARTVTEARTERRNVLRMIEAYP
jgi:hypothetical protein